MAGARARTAYGSLLKQLEILPIPCQYMNFFTKKQEIFQTNQFIRSIYTRNKQHIHKPNVNITFSPKSIFYAGK